MRYPPKVALDLARSLTAEGASQTDSRVAQLKFDELIDQASGHPSLSGEKIANRITAKRAERMAAAAMNQRTLADREAIALRDAVRQAELRAERESSQTQRLAAQVVAEGNLNRRLQGQLDELNQLGPRRTAHAIILTLVVIAALGMLWFRWWWTLFGLVVGVCIYWNRAQDWLARPEVNARRMYIALLPELLAGLDLIREFRS